MVKELYSECTSHRKSVCGHNQSASVSDREQVSTWRMSELVRDQPIGLLTNSTNSLKNPLTCYSVKRAHKHTQFSQAFCPISMCANIWRQAVYPQTCHLTPDNTHRFIAISIRPQSSQLVWSGPRWVYQPRTRVTVRSPVGSRTG